MCVYPSTFDHVHSELSVQGITTPVHCIHFLLQRLLQIMYTHGKKKNSVLSASPGEQTNGRKYFSFPFASYTTTKLCAFVFPDFSPFLTALQANPTKHKLRDVRRRCIVSCLFNAVQCAGWATDSGHTPAAHVERSVTALISRRPSDSFYIICARTGDEQLSLLVIVIGTYYARQTSSIW